MNRKSTTAQIANGSRNRLLLKDRSAHDWYRFVLSFPPHLVRTYLDRFEVTKEQCVLDPFCGTGTTLVECKKRGVPGVGIEANPMAAFASRVKTDWGLLPGDLMNHAEEIAERVRDRLEQEGIDDTLFFSAPRRLPKPLRTLPEEQSALLLSNSISPLPLHKTLVLLDLLEEEKKDALSGHERLALASALVQEIGNLHFGPEVGVGPPKRDALVTGAWLAHVQEMARDLRELRPLRHVSSVVLQADSRRIGSVVEPESIDAVITSPPYPNEKDYSRTTRLESVLLGFIRNKAELRDFKKGLVRSNTRGVYVADEDDQWLSGHPEVERIASSIEARRIELGKTSGFERLYARVTRLYFGGMARHLAELRIALKPGASLAYVVGDQASYLRVMIRTGNILADIAKSLGYEVIGLDLFRTRLATATREQLREEVLVLHWPGPKSHPAPSGAREAPAPYKRKRKHKQRGK
jgi:DNA modification methylase